MSTKNIFRIHPAIGMARVGNSEEYFIGPETMAGMDGENPGDPMGGLPIKADGSERTVESNDLRDGQGKLKREAARFRIYGYTEAEINTYPTGAGTEVKIGSQVLINGVRKTVKDIFWQVHLANKKANTWEIPEIGIEAYESKPGCESRTPMYRNAQFNNDVISPGTPDDGICNSREVLNETARREKLVIDAGPHVVSSLTQTSATFNRVGANSHMEQNGSSYTPKYINYPRQFPEYPSSGVSENERIDTLGNMHPDKEGRLIICGGYGKASGFDLKTGAYVRNQNLDDAINNDGWFDDTADGPVTAILQFTDNSTHKVEGSSWIVVSDPSYAPQIANVVSLWEDIYNTWVENFDLEPSMYSSKLGATPVTEDKYNLGKGYNPNYAPDFKSQIKPILNAANLQMWATNLVNAGKDNHKAVAALPQNNPNWPQLLDFMRNPNDALNNDGETLRGNNANPQNGTRMPLSLGDEDQDFLNISRTQYFFMYQWLISNKTTSDRVLGDGEKLDRNVLGNCLGGRFSPGIEMTFIVRDTHLYKNWKDGNAYLDCGPFRINEAYINYNNLSTPALGVGYQPLQKYAVEPGDICKFMSIPWHTDYNSCATHTTVNADITRSNMTYWSWPAQRPVAVYTYEDLVCDKGELKTQRFSVRGSGTEINPNNLPPGVPLSEISAQVGRFQRYIDFMYNWQKVGIVIQGTAISNPDRSIPADVLKSSFLEVESLFEKDMSNRVIPGPIPANQAVAPPPPMCPHAAKHMNKD